MTTHRIEVFGNVVDNQTRCVHYNTKLDIVAIQFRCCGRYYPCYQCHNEAENHPIQRWPAAAGETKAILCGVCRTEMAISSYMKSASCPSCGSVFNPNCNKHFGLYFETKTAPPVNHPL